MKRLDRTQARGVSPVSGSARPDVASRTAGNPLVGDRPDDHDVGMSDQHNVVRVWRGVVRTADRDEYVDYVERTGIEQYRSTPGNRDAWTLTRELTDGLTEIITLSRWDSLESIRGFAGDDIDQAVYYPDDDRFLVERDDTVRHYVQRS